MSYILDGKHIVMGTDYYPEHWDENMWKNDLDRMLRTGVEVIRIAEFAWNKFEPREGDYTFDFFDRFLDLCEKKGMKVIFCTPSATPPAWMSDKYPEILNARMDGVLYRHGARRHYNYNSFIYQRFTRNIVQRIAEHYAKRPCIIGWQIDNEINCEMNEFYSESDSLAFREFLKNKYGSIEQLNKAWGTVFWNQTYTSWGEVYVPRTTLSNAVNPHEVLDYKRFISDSACRWCKMQSDIIRKYIKQDDFVTTNGLFGDLDNHRMARESLDFMTYDSYPNMAFGLHSHFEQVNKLKDRQWCMNLDEVRSLKGNFGIMEQQSGANGWNTAMESPTPRPGQITLWTMQSIAHGADFISYFRWRTATIGTEIYWHGILDYSDRDNRRLSEVRNIHTKLQRISELAGSEYYAEVGVLETYDNKWDAELDAWHKLIASTSMNGLYTASQLTHTPVDFVYLQTGTTINDLKKYKVLFYPHAVILTKEQADLLTAYVEQGGTLVFGCRAGQKNTQGHCVQDKLPGQVRQLTGADVLEYTMVAPDEGTVYVNLGDTQIEAAAFNDELAPLEGATVLGRYANSYYQGVPALIEKHTGKGKTLYFGGAFTAGTAKIFFEKLDIIHPLQKFVDGPEEVEIASRNKNGKHYIFVLNYSKTQQQINIGKTMLNLYTGERASGQLTMKPYETVILTPEEGIN